MALMGTSPVMARGTAGVESAGGAEQATSARLEALGPGHMARWHLQARYRALVALVDDIQAICVPSAGRFVVRREGLGCEGGRGWLGEACDDDDDDGEAVSVS